MVILALLRVLGGARYLNVLCGEDIDFMILSDFDLENYIREGRLSIRPFDKEIIRENGVDLRLSDEVARHNSGKPAGMIVDPSDSKSLKDEYVLRKKQKEIIIGPQEQMLLSTYEFVEFPDNLMGFVELRSTWARHGLFMPPTIIDAGFAGNVTLEVFNSSRFSILLRPKVRFAHIIFATTLNRVRNAYKGKYLNQKGIHLPKLL